jgi:hypothetical protein
MNRLGPRFLAVEHGFVVVVSFVVTRRMKT